MEIFCIFLAIINASLLFLDFENYSRNLVSNEPHEEEREEEDWNLDDGVDDYYDPTGRLIWF